FFPRLAHLPCHLPPQPCVARQTENVVHTVAFTPLHQFLAAEPGVGAQDDLRLRPAGPYLRHDALHLDETACAGVLIGGPQPRAQQMLSTEDVERQVTVVAVIAVKEAPSCSPCSGVSVTSRSSTISRGGSGCASRKMSTSSASSAWAE